MKFDEKTVAEVLQEGGYKKVAHRIYRALWSTAAVEHFIYLELWGSPQTFLATRFGLRCVEAEVFAQSAVRRHGGATYNLMDEDRANRCFMTFSLGRLAGWEPRESLNLRALTQAELMSCFRSACRDHLLPVIGEVTTPRKLYEFLGEDAEPHRWIRTNAAIRAAIIVKLAAMLGEKGSDVNALVEPQFGPISGQLQGISAQAFLEIIRSDAGLRGPTTPDTTALRR